MGAALLYNFPWQHGKGVVDRFGGTVKRFVWRYNVHMYVQSRKAQAVTPMSFFQVAVDRNPNVCIHFIPKTVIEQHKTMLGNPLLTKLFQYPTLKKLHSLKTKGKLFF